MYLVRGCGIDYVLAKFSVWCTSVFVMPCANVRVLYLRVKVAEC